LKANDGTQTSKPEIVAQPGTPSSCSARTQNSQPETTAQPEIAESQLDTPHSPLAPSSPLTSQLVPLNSPTPLAPSAPSLDISDVPNCHYPSPLTSQLAPFNSPFPSSIPQNPTKSQHKKYPMNPIRGRRFTCVEG
jgi:hypothetical protein